MAYFHGVRVSEIPTRIITPVQTTAGLPVVFGTAPVHLAEDPEAYANKPVICYEYKEAVAALGYSADWDKYTLCEAMYTEFYLYAVKPIIFVNVLNPKKHKKSVEVTLDVASDGTVTVEDPVLLKTLSVAPGSVTYTASTPTMEVEEGSWDGDGDGDSGTVVSTPAATEPAAGSGTPSAPAVDVDYTAAFDDDGRLIVTIIKDGLLDGQASLKLSYDCVDPSMVTEADIIGGVDSNGNVTGLELINSIYTMFSLVPGIIAAPGWTHIPEVAAVMKAKALAINTIFRCIVLTDVDTEACKRYSDVNQWKNNNSYTGVNQVVCWPCVRMGSHVYHMSTHIMGIIGVMDAANTDVPYQSPSNLAMQATGICLKDGTEVSLTLEQANLLNSQGIMTALNFIGGWKSWGNYTGAYPGTTDVKDTFICVRRMFDWQYQTFILTYWQKVDRPLNKRLVRSIIDSEQIRLNGLVSREYLLGAEVQFLEEENPFTDLLAGIFRVHTKLTPPVPAQDIEDILEYETSYFKRLFETE